MMVPRRAVPGGSEDGLRHSLALGRVPATSAPAELAQFQARESPLRGRIAEAAQLPKE